jgi:hypothetical protein
MQRMERAMMNVYERLEKTKQTLFDAKIPFAIVGGHAVAHYVSTKDSGAVRLTRDVDVLIRRIDLDVAIHALEDAGFIHEEILGLHLLRDSPDGKPSEGVHILFADEPVERFQQISTPALEGIPPAEDFPTTTLQQLLVMKLVANRRKDQVHIIDMIRVGLIDQTWTDRVPEVLRERLQILLDDPNG